MKKSSKMLCGALAALLMTTSMAQEGAANIQVVNIAVCKGSFQWAGVITDKTVYMKFGASGLTVWNKDNQNNYHQVVSLDGMAVGDYSNSREEATRTFCSRLQTMYQKNYAKLYAAGVATGNANMKKCLEGPFNGVINSSVNTQTNSTASIPGNTGIVDCTGYIGK